MSRRRTLFCRLALALPLAICVATPTRAASYPERPIKVLVGFPAGQGTDVFARLVAQKAAEDLKGTIYVDNRPGAGGAIALQMVKNAAPDGYTLAMSSGSALVINPALYRTLPYDTLKDFEPVVAGAAAPLMLIANPALGVNNLAEMIAYVKARPGKVSFGSTGNGTTSHIAMEMLKRATGIDMVHVPYKGSGPMLTDLIGGQIAFAMDGATVATPQSASGLVKLLGVASAKRLPIAPAVPTLDEQGLHGFEAAPWSGLLAPKGTPPEIVGRLNAAFNKALQDPAVVAQLKSLGTYSLGGTQAQFQSYIRSELDRWGKAVRESGAHIE